MTKEEQKKLRAQAHALKPVIMIGHAGLTEAVVTEIESALASHELIKIKIQSDNRDLRKQIAHEICARCSAQFIQSIGKILTIYRKNPDQ